MNANSRNSVHPQPFSWMIFSHFVGTHWFLIYTRFFKCAQNKKFCAINTQCKVTPPCHPVSSCQMLIKFHYFVFFLYLRSVPTAYLHYSAAQSSGLCHRSAASSHPSPPAAPPPRHRGVGLPLRQPLSRRHGRACAPCFVFPREKRSVTHNSPSEFPLHVVAVPSFCLAGIAS